MQEKQIETTALSMTIMPLQNTRACFYYLCLETQELHIFYLFKQYSISLANSCAIIGTTATGSQETWGAYNLKYNIFASWWTGGADLAPGQLLLKKYSKFFLHFFATFAMWNPPSVPLRQPLKFKGIIVKCSPKTLEDWKPLFELAIWRFRGRSSQIPY